MLSVGLREGEVLLIGEGVALLVIEARQGRARLGIVAPRSVPVLRAELEHERKTAGELEMERQRERYRASRTP